MKFFTSLILCVAFATSAFAHPVPHDPKTIHIVEIDNNCVAMYGQPKQLNRAMSTVLDLVWWKDGGPSTKEQVNDFAETSNQYLITEDSLKQNEQMYYRGNDFLTDEIKEKFIKIMAIKGIKVIELDNPRVYNHVSSDKDQ